VRFKILNMINNDLQANQIMRINQEINYISNLVDEDLIQSIEELFFKYILEKDSIKLDRNPFAYSLEIVIPECSIARKDKLEKICKQFKKDYIRRINKEITDAFNLYEIKCKIKEIIECNYVLSSKNNPLRFFAKVSSNLNFNVNDLVEKRQELETCFINKVALIEKLLRKSIQVYCFESMNKNIDELYREITDKIGLIVNKGCGNNTLILNISYYPFLQENQRFKFTYKQKTIVSEPFFKINDSDTQFSPPLLIRARSAPIDIPHSNKIPRRKFNHKNFYTN
ncbi:MAG: hypothetical protein JWM09_800, partial [Francisellaceae bacterium]|nr:hypothetical protein [Francisellaceae bacterium]